MSWCNHCGLADPCADTSEQHIASLWFVPRGVTLKILYGHLAMPLRHKAKWFHVLSRKEYRT